MQRKFKYALFSTIGLLSLMLLPLSTRGDDIGHIAFSSDRGESHDIYIIDTNGQNLENLTNTPNISESSPTWSPDGRSLAYHAYEKRNADLYVLDLETQTRRRLTDHPSEDRAPAWSPDGKWIAFISNRRASYEIYRISPKGGEPRLLTRLRRRNNYGPAWSPDSQWIAFFSVSKREEAWDPRVYVVSVSGKRMRPLAPSLRVGPTWSPTGDEIAFPASSGPWTSHIHIMNAMGKDVRPLTQGRQWHEDPAWSPNGRWIVYTSGAPVRGDSKRDIYLINVLGGESRQLTRHPSGGRNPTWVPVSYFSVSPSVEQLTTLWGKLKQP